MPKHIITLVNNADISNTEQAIVASVRESRAIRRARKLAQTNPNVMLFKVDGDRRTPISIKRSTFKPFSRDAWLSNNGNNHFIGMPVDA